MKKIILMFLVVILCLTVLCPNALASQATDESTPTDITNKCNFIPSSNKDSFSKATDEKLSTSWIIGDDEEKFIIIDIPKTVTDRPLGIYLQWTSNLTPWEFFAITDEAIVSIATGGDEFYGEWISIPEEYSDCRFFMFNFDKGEPFSLAEIRIFSHGIPYYIPQWEKYNGQSVYALVIVCHPDDESLYFAAFMAYIREAGMDTVVVFMNGENSRRRLEAQESVWTLGSHLYPVIRMKKPGSSGSSSGDKINGWSYEENVEFIVEQIRKYRPQIVITHDQRGEYGHDSHKKTFKAVCKAVTVSGDLDQFPESAQEYGVWTADELYVHLYGQNQIFFDIDKELSAFDGSTAFDLAKAAFDRHKSQHNGNHTVQKDSIDGWPMAEFGLFWINPNLLDVNSILENSSQ
ncbi:MAG: PIG-L family deacetylase [Candidatus Shapirobacteria bacterium]|nr:PIG-L family deacetylase [Candidatus Shapirobacteria bacterium]